MSALTQKSKMCSSLHLQHFNTLLSSETKKAPWTCIVNPYINMQMRDSNLSYLNLMVFNTLLLVPVIVIREHYTHTACVARQAQLN